jgi:hypothetical protein
MKQNKGQPFAGMVRITNTMTRMFIYTPYGYENGTTKYRYSICYMVPVVMKMPEHHGPYLSDLDNLIEKLLYQCLLLCQTEIVTAAARTLMLPEKVIDRSNPHLQTHM